MENPKLKGVFHYIGTYLISASALYIVLGTLLLDFGLTTLLASCWIAIVIVVMVYYQNKGREFYIHNAFVIVFVATLWLLALIGGICIIASNPGEYLKQCLMLFGIVMVCWTLFKSVKSVRSYFKQ